MPDITTTCDGCGGRATFADLEALMKRSGFCNDVCAARYSRAGFKKEEDRTCVGVPRVAVRGPRADLRGVSFRSAMEANCARFFNFSGLEWTYEPETFQFREETQAPVNYKPDFRVAERKQKYWVEVKGRWTGHDRQKIRKMKKYYPRDFAQMWIICRWSKGRKGEDEQRLIRGISPHIRVTDYKQLRALRQILPGWEGR